ncbi:hypothetical protein YC2023_029762 [Brassica napus]
MASYKLTVLLLLSFIFLFLSGHVLSDIGNFISLTGSSCSNEEDVLFKGINSYKASQNLTTLNNNENAECLADEIADQLKNNPCTNDTGSATVPGTEPQFSDYPNILAKCHLSVSDTRDGLIMPACVPFLESSPSLVLTNFTKSQYSLSLNDSKFTGMGIGKEDDWIVVVLTTNTPQGSFSTATKVDSNGFIFAIGFFHYVFVFILSFCFFLC